MTARAAILVRPGPATGPLFTTAEWAQVLDLLDLAAGTLLESAATLAVRCPGSTAIDRFRDHAAFAREARTRIQAKGGMS